MVPIRENYKDYQPPDYVRPAIARILSSLPKHYIADLQSVILTNAKAIGKGKTQRVKGKKHLRQDCLGYYHPKSIDQQPWIEIVVDNVIATRRTPRFLMLLPLMRNLALADVLFHEIGHHLDCIIGAPARTGEAAAEAWQGRLLASYFRKQYGYLLPLVRIAEVLFGSTIRTGLKSVRPD